VAVAGLLTSALWLGWSGASVTVGQGEPGIGVLGADTVVLTEPFDVEADWMGIGSDETGENALVDGALFSSVIAPSGNIWTDLALDEPVEVLRVQADVTLDGRPGTAAGPACGTSHGLPRYLVAGVNQDGWWLGRLIDTRLQVIVAGDLPAVPGEGQALTVAIECASVPDEGGDLVTMSVDGQAVDVDLPRLEIPVGPYDRAALLVATDRRRGHATYDDLLISTGAAHAPAVAQPDPASPSPSGPVL
jgi:hypothetical protein